MVNFEQFFAPKQEKANEREQDEKQQNKIKKFESKELDKSTLFRDGEGNLYDIRHMADRSVVDDKNGWFVGILHVEDPEREFERIAQHKEDGNSENNSVANTEVHRPLYFSGNWGEELKKDYTDKPEVQEAIKKAIIAAQENENLHSAAYLYANR